MKRTLNWMMGILTMMLICPLGALAAPGDAVVFGMNDEDAVFILNSAVVGDTGYMLGEENGAAYLWTIRAGETEARAYEFPRDSGKGIYESSIRLFGYDGQLMGLHQKNGMVYRLELTDGRVTLTEAVQLDYSGMIVGSGKYSYARLAESICVVGDELIMNVRLPMPNEEETELMAFSLIDGTCRLIGKPEMKILRVTPGREEKLLTAVRNEEDYTIPKTLYEISVSDGSMAALTELAASGVYGLVYDEAKDRVIYYSDNVVYATGMDGVHETLCSIGAEPAGSYSDSFGLLTSDCYFVSTEMTTVIKNINPDEQATRVLTLGGYTSDADEAYKLFAFRHPEAEIRTARQGVTDASEITQGMMTGSNEVDIFFLRVDSAAYRALTGRGYAADLSQSEKIKNLTERMYPAFRDALMKDGKIVALPEYVWSAAGCRIYQPLAEEMGLTDEEIPDSWEKLMDLVSRWEEEYSKEFAEKMIFEPYSTANMKETLLNMLLDAQVVLMNQPGAEVSVNTPFMREMLNRLDAMDYSSFETDRDFSNGYSWKDDAVLLENLGIPLPVDLNNDSEWATLPMDYSEDEAGLIGVQMYAFVVNPYSENVDLAIEYLKARADTMTDGLRATLLSDWTEPIRDYHYDLRVGRLESNIKGWREQFETADDDEKKMLEANIRSAEEEIEGLKPQEYSWTAEELAEYRELAGQIVVIENQYFLTADGEEAEEMQRLISRYVDGQMSAEQMLSALDQKLRMMQMEEGY